MTAHSTDLDSLDVPSQADLFADGLSMYEPLPYSTSEEEAREWARAAGAQRHAEAKRVRKAQAILASADFGAWLRVIRGTPILKPAPAPLPEAKSGPRCICELDEACLSVRRADEYGHPVSDAIRAEATLVEMTCRATIHYPTVTATEWLGRDVETSDSRTKTDYKRDQQELAEMVYAQRTAVHDQAAYEKAESGAAYITARAEEARARLIELMTALGLDPHALAPWVQETIRTQGEAILDNGLRPEKQGYGSDHIRLRAYSICIRTLEAKLDAEEVTPC